jgi:hypothetical protein
MRLYCGFCSLIVAPADPQKVTKGDRTYHFICWERKKAREFEAQRQEVMELQIESDELLPDLPFQFY